MLPTASSVLEVLNSERLSYRLLDPDSAADADLLFELDQDVEVMRFINGGKLTTREDQKEKYLPRLRTYTQPAKGWGMWGMFLQDGKFIGWILVRPMDFFSPGYDERNLELGWRLSQDAWGKGYGTEGANQVMQALMGSDMAHTYTALAMPDNSGSINIMKKLGMTYIKTETHKDPLGDLEAVFYELKAD